MELHVFASTLDRITASGRDAASFLQGMVTNDVVGLLPGHGCYAFQLDPTGHVLADMTILRHEDGIDIVTDPGFGADVLERLESYLIMERCRLQLSGKGIPTFLLWGLDALECVHALGAVGLESEGDHCSIEGFGETNRLARLPACLGPAYRWIVDPEFLTASQERLKGLGAVLQPVHRWDSHRIASGIPVFGVDFDSKTLALETGQASRAVHFRKGCYIGQEIVARIDARGRVRKELKGLILESVPDSASKLHLDGREVGWITSRVSGGQSGNQAALGYVRTDDLEPGVTWVCGGGTVRLAPSRETPQT